MKIDRTVIGGQAVPIRPLLMSTGTVTKRAKLQATASRGRDEFDRFDEWRRN